jgi:hypothetical protein
MLKLQIDIHIKMYIATYDLIIFDSVKHCNPSSFSDEDNMDAETTLARYPAFFSSQARLFAWIERSRSTTLARVRSLTLQLTDIDLSPLLQSPSSQVDARLPAFGLYSEELKRLCDALAALPNLSNLTVVPPKGIRTTLLKGMYVSFLTTLPEKCKNLKQVQLYDDKDNLGSTFSLKDIEVTFKSLSALEASQSRNSKSDSSGESASPRKQRKRNVTRSKE